MARSIEQILIDVGFDLSNFTPEAQQMLAQMGLIENKLNQTAEAAGRTKEEQGGLEKANRRATQGMIALSQGLEDAQYGLRAVANNISQLGALMGLSGKVMIGITTMLIVLPKLGAAFSSALSAGITSAEEFRGVFDDIIKLQDKSRSFGFFGEEAEGLLEEFKRQQAELVAGIAARQGQGVTQEIEDEIQALEGLIQRMREEAALHRIRVKGYDAIEGRIRETTDAIEEQGSAVEEWTGVWGEYEKLGVTIIEQEETLAFLRSEGGEAYKTLIARSKELADQIKAEIGGADELTASQKKQLELQKEFATLQGPGGRAFVAREVELEQLQRKIKALRESLELQINEQLFRSMADAGVFTFQLEALAPELIDLDELKKELDKEAREFIEQIKRDMPKVSAASTPAGAGDAHDFPDPSTRFKEAAASAEQFRSAMQFALVDGLMAVGEGMDGAGNRIVGVLGSLLVNIGQGMIKLGAIGGALQKFVQGHPELAAITGAAAIVVGRQMMRRAQQSVGNAFGLGGGGGLLAGASIVRTPGVPGFGVGGQGPIQVQGRIIADGHVLTVLFDNKRAFDQAAGRT